MHSWQPCSLCYQLLLRGSPRSPDEEDHMRVKIFTVDIGACKQTLWGFVCRDLCIQLCFDWEVYALRVVRDLEENQHLILCAQELGPKLRNPTWRQIHPDFVNVWVWQWMRKPKALKGSIWFFFWYILLNRRKQSRKADLYILASAPTSQGEDTSRLKVFQWVFFQTRG